jgi:hypothetical protein
MRGSAIIAMLTLGLVAGCSSGSGKGGTGGAGGGGGGGGLADAAGADGMAGTPTFTTALAATTPLGQISSAQLTTLCTDLESYGMTVANSASFKPTYCKLVGLGAGSLAIGPNATDATVQQACSTALADCTSSDPVQIQHLGCSVRPSSGCTATVGQYATCLDDAIAADVAASASLPACSSLTVSMLRGDGGTTTGFVPAPASCMTFGAACPSSAGAGDVPPPTMWPRPGA